MLYISNRKAFTLIEIMIVVAIIAVLIAVALPNYLKSGTMVEKTICMNNLKKIDAAIDQWAIEHRKSPGMQPSASEEDEIYNYIRGGKPLCPAGGEYTIYAVGDKPQVRCTLEEQGHKLLE